ncbi:hypothetical protein, partial [Bradyrhizobium sp. AS23.2]|uniref:hypothetical protein n=1 Tax=Bradyrhizobium sp. AS23.2 TaxID=1680155 RepID=UPI001AD82030
FGRSLDDPTREHRPPAMIGDHGRMPTYPFAHNQDPKPTSSAKANKTTFALPLRSPSPLGRSSAQSSFSL